MSDKKHLYHAYSGCIRFKSLRPKVLRTLGRHNFKPDTSLIPRRDIMFIVPSSQLLHIEVILNHVPFK